jgi:hypothetical protein
MLQEYFTIIRKALSENRVKGKTYYEAHHVVPKSFNKQSGIVLLTPEEHYRCHKILAEVFQQHSVYGKKMLWAFHRMTYSKKRKLSEEDYGEARRILTHLWTRKRTEEHRKNISQAQLGNTNNKSRVFKGMKSGMSKEGKQKLAELRRKKQTGKVGVEANASKGAVVLEYRDGRKFEAGSALQLAVITGVPQPTLSDRLRKQQKDLIRGFKVYYKN